MITHHILDAGSVESLGVDFQISVKEEDGAVAMLLLVGQNAVTRATVVTPSVFLHHVAHVDEAIF